MAGYPRHIRHEAATLIDQGLTDKEISSMINSAHGKRSTIATVSTWRQRLYVGTMDKEGHIQHPSAPIVKLVEPVEPVETTSTEVLKATLLLAERARIVAGCNDLSDADIKFIIGG